MSCIRLKSARLRGTNLLYLMYWYRSNCEELVYLLIKTMSHLVAYGTYTPTLTNTTNIGASTARLATYMRVWNTVTVAWQIDIDPTATWAVLLGISLPIASDFSTVYQLWGTGSSIAIANESYGIEADSTNNRASMKNIAVSTANHTVIYQYSYQII